MQWLWPTFIQCELDHLRKQLNNHPTSFDPAKKLPSGVSPNISIALADEYGGESCLLPVDLAVICHLKDGIGGKDLVCFVNVGFAHSADTAFSTLGIDRTTSDNIWHVFMKMLPLL